MTFRTRILLACLAAAILPLALVAAGARHTVRERLTEQYRERVSASAENVRGEVAAEADRIDALLRSLAMRITDDPFSRAALTDAGRRTALIGYAPDAMAMAGLDYLLLLDEGGVVLSSGHFRAEFDRVMPLLTEQLRAVEGFAMIAARRPAGEFLALVRAVPFDLAGRTFTLAGGAEVDSAFIARFAAGWSDALVVDLDHPGGEIASARGEIASAHVTSGEPEVTERLTIPFIDAAGIGVATFTITHSLEPLRSVLREMDRWFIIALVAAALLATILARMLAERVNRPLEDLAREASRVELSRHDAELATHRQDEIGTLSRVLDRMVKRLRTGAQKLRDAERRATVGDMARQVNHDIRNGLLPIRNVIHHLSEVARESPDELGDVFAERAGTLEGGIGYLETLATNYARLSPRADRKRCDVNLLLGSIVDAALAGDARLRIETDASVPAVTCDPIALRRVVENLAINALESLPDGAGTVTIRTSAVGGGHDARVVIAVSDTGSGIAPDQLERVFDDFFTTKSRGTGLGLSIVRRLVADMGGRIRATSTVGRGTTFTVELPALVSRESSQPVPG